MRRQVHDSLRSNNIIKLTGDYYVDRSQPLGSGRFGVVYKGFNNKKDQIIAVKFLSNQVMNSVPKYEREIIVLEDIAKFMHPNIMGYYGYHQNQEGLYIFMEFCSGGTLTKFIQQGISQLKIVSLFEQIISAMVFMNQNEKLHRDLKPDNILLNQRMNIKIGDFGLARDIDRMMTKQVGTPLYNAPEILKRESEYNQKCDVWSVGLVLYNMLTQEELFKNVQRTNELLIEFKKFENNTFVINLPVHLHSAWKKILTRMLVFRQSSRPTFKQLQRQFSQVLDEIRSDLILRYGYQNVEQEEEEILRLTRSHINPYEPAVQVVAQNRLNDMLIKLKQERSFTCISNVRKWLNFVSSKFETMLSIINQFNGCPYNFMLNIYKYIIMFLIISGFIAKHNELINAIKNKQLSTPDENFEEDKIVPIHRAYFDQMLSDMTDKFNALIRVNKKTLENQIIKDILGKYLQREEEKQILSSIGGLLDLIKNAEKNVFEPYKTYESMYKQVIGLEDVYFNIETIKGSQKFELKQIRVYTYIRLAANLDIVLPNIQYKNEDYLKLKKQSFQNSTKQQLLHILNRINAR